MCENYPEYRRYLKAEHCCNTIQNRSKHIVTAPLYQQVFKWFKDEYGKDYEEAQLKCINELIKKQMQNKLDLKTLEERLDITLNKETVESLKNWLYQKRNKMMSKTVRRLLDSTPKNVEVFVRWYADLTVVINRLIEQKNIDKEIPEIKEYLSGSYSFDLKSLSKLSEVLDYNLLNINKEILNNDI